ncbi:hypothetical protein ABEB36_003146 [Hypothenemus hampei]|uniref:Pyroglutamyl-peptidase I n=1 Tax=Hypothenemus hampei TaxID=57062 RepID=A0ABD1F870_HYPHA
MTNKHSENVLVTGFGPFNNVPINASWEAVALLPNEINNCNIIKEQIPVAYKHVQENIPILWEKYKPKLVIHVGVSSIAEDIVLETCANRVGYQRKDIDDCCPDGGEACCGKSNPLDCITTMLCTKTISEYVFQRTNLNVSISNDPGRYLCEFIYYNSLSQDRKRTLFVHVPPLNQPFSKSELVQALQEIIKCALELLESEEKSKYSIYPPGTTKIYKNGRAAAF